MADSPTRSVRVGPQRRGSCCDCTPREVVFRVPLPQGSQQHLHTVVVAVPLNLLAHHLKEGIGCRWLRLRRRETDIRRRPRECKNLLDPTRRAAQLLGDGTGAHAVGGGLDDHPPVNGTEHHRR